MKNAKNMGSGNSTVWKILLSLLGILLISGSVYDDNLVLDLVDSIQEKAILPDLSSIDFGTLRFGGLLVTGWETNSRWGKTVTVNWINNQRAVLKLPRFNISDKIVFMRMRPFGSSTSPDQWCEFYLNDVFLHKIRLERNWWSYELQIPADMFNAEENLLEMKFSHLEDANAPQKIIFYRVDEELNLQQRPRVQAMHKPRFLAAAFDYLVLYDQGIDLEKRSDRFFNKFVVTGKQKINDHVYRLMMYYPQGEIPFHIRINDGDHLRFIPVIWKIRPDDTGDDAVTFQVILTDSRDITRTLYMKKITGDEPEEIPEVVLDLSIFKGQKVILTFQTVLDQVFAHENMLGMWGEPVIFQAESASPAVYKPLYPVSNNNDTE